MPMKLFHFPDPSYKMGPRAMPSQVPIIPDQSLEAQRRKLANSLKLPINHFVGFAGNDPQH